MEASMNLMVLMTFCMNKSVCLRLSTIPSIFALICGRKNEPEKMMILFLRVFESFFSIADSNGFLLPQFDRRKLDVLPAFLNCQKGVRFDCNVGYAHMCVRFSVALQGLDHGKPESSDEYIVNRHLYIDVGHFQ